MVVVGWVGLWWGFVSGSLTLSIWPSSRVSVYAMQPAIAAAADFWGEASARIWVCGVASIAGARVCARCGRLCQLVCVRVCVCPHMLVPLLLAGVEGCIHCGSLHQVFADGSIHSS